MVIAAIALSALFQTSLTLLPKDDIWCYPHATDPEKDAYLRIWGTEGRAVPSDDDTSNFSFSLMQWDVSALPTAKLTGAKLVLTQIANPKYSLAQATKFPLEARTVASGFTEKGWTYDSLPKFMPGKTEKSIFGTGFPDPFPKADEESTITIELLKGPGDFAKSFADAVASNKLIAIALTSPLDVTLNPDVQTVYKLYSKDAPIEKVKPKLILTFEK